MSNETVVVPVEPTEEMMLAGLNDVLQPLSGPKSIYRAMIAAAPQQPAPPALGSDGLARTVLAAAKGDWPDDAFEDVIDYLEAAALAALQARPASGGEGEAMTAAIKAAKRLYPDSAQVAQQTAFLEGTIWFNNHASALSQPAPEGEGK